MVTRPPLPPPHLSRKMFTHPRLLNTFDDDVIDAVAATEDAGDGPLSSASSLLCRDAKLLNDGGAAAAAAVDEEGAIVI